MRTPPFKVIALDCDDTLWRGICGEDGPQGVVLDPPRRALQEFMLAQHAQGMLLTLCSKNNVEDVLDTFHLASRNAAAHGAFRRVAHQLVAKSANLAALAEELELGLDSFILVDDNPRECREVETAYPQVLALLLPPRDEEIPEFLRARVGFRPVAGHRGRPPPARHVCAGARAPARRKAGGQPGGFSRVA